MNITSRPDKKTPVEWAKRLESLRNRYDPNASQSGYGGSFRKNAGRWQNCKTGSFVDRLVNNGS